MLNSDTVLTGGGWRIGGIWGLSGLKIHERLPKIRRKEKKKRRKRRKRKGRGKEENTLHYLTHIIINFANLSDEWGYLLLCATVGWGELSYQCLMYWIMGLLHFVHLLCSYSGTCKELISLSSLKIRPEINTNTQLWNALKLFLGDKLLLRYIDSSTKLTPIEFIRQIIKRELNHFCPVCRADIY